MPTYEYECEKCRKKFEVVQSMNDAVLKVCTEDLCRMKKWGKGAVRRMIGSGAGLLFKGSGFYITDYRSEGYRQAAKKDTASSEPAKTDKPSADKPKPAAKNSGTKKNE